MASKRADALVAILGDQKYTPREAFVNDLTAALQSDGYTVVPVEAVRRNNDYLSSYPGAPVDAYLDVAVTEYGYLAAGVSELPTVSAVSLSARQAGARRRTGAC
ncbi:MAG: hypothetical protein WDM81_09355 [Rhizomicrobium sp.]